MNINETLTNQELKNETDIPEKDLLRNLQPLALGKMAQRILSKEPKSREIGTVTLLRWGTGGVFHLF